MDLGPIGTLVEHLSITRAIIGFFLVFLLPGFAWTLVLFRQVNIIERIALSFGLSIAVVTLGIMALNMVLGMKINGTNSLLFIIAVTVIGFAIYLLRRHAARRKEPADGE